MQVTVLPAANLHTLSSLGLVWGVSLGDALAGCPYRPSILHNGGGLGALWGSASWAQARPKNKSQGHGHTHAPTHNDAATRLHAPICPTR